MEHSQLCLPLICLPGGDTDVEVEERVLFLEIVFINISCHH